MLIAIGATADGVAVGLKPQFCALFHPRYRTCFLAINHDKRLNKTGRYLVGLWPTAHARALFLTTIETIETILGWPVANGSRECFVFDDNRDNRDNFGWPVANGSRKCFVFDDNRDNRDNFFLC